MHAVNTIAYFATKVTYVFEIDPILYLYFNENYQFDGKLPE